MVYKADERDERSKEVSKWPGRKGGKENGSHLLVPVVFVNLMHEIPEGDVENRTWSDRTIVVPKIFGTYKWL